MVAAYRGKLYWFWGDTNRLSYPLGNFAATGATSELPGSGGLAPATGIDLNYFTRSDGFVKSVLDIPGDGLKWLFGLMTLNDPAVPSTPGTSSHPVRPPYLQCKTPAKTES